MHNGDPKLVCHDKTCHYCKTLCKDIVETWAVYNFAPDFHVCETCSARIEKENEESKIKSHNKRLESFLANLDFLAKDTGWSKNEAGQWYNQSVDQWSLVHPIAVEKPDDLLQYVPQGWVLRYDIEDVIAYDSRITIAERKYHRTLLLDHHGFTSDESLIQDILDMIVHIRKIVAQ